MRRRKRIRNYYKILQVPFESTADEIRTAYRKLAKQYHPDVNKSPDANAMMKLINEAYAVLGDKKRRMMYDYILFGTLERMARKERETPADYSEMDPIPRSHSPRPVRQPPQAGPMQSFSSIYNFDISDPANNIKYVPIFVTVFLMFAGSTSSDAAFDALTLAAILSFGYLVMNSLRSYFGVRFNKQPTTSDQ
jgi:curved DNA-binding protein CbpA